jgi:hypothetical protein
MSCERCGSPDILETFRMKALTLPEQYFDLVVRMCGECAHTWQEER